MTACIIVGTGGFALELFDLLSDCGNVVTGFIGPRSERNLPVQWIGDDSELERLEPTTVYVAIGDPQTRCRVSARVRSEGHALRSFVHPNAWVASSATLADGVLIYPNSTVHAGSALSSGVVVISNASVGHETRLGAYCNVGPGVSLGGCGVIGECSYFGIGSSTLENLHVIAGVTIGAGATVVRSIDEPGCYVGTPAMRIHQ